MRAAERVQAEEDMEAAGLWVGTRHTICAGCGRRTVTDADRSCRRCTFVTFNEFADSFEVGELETEEAA